MQNNSNLLTIGESATYLGVSIDTLRRWDNKGIISAYRSPSGHRYFDKNDLSKLFGQKYTHIRETETNEDEAIVAENLQNLRPHLVIKPKDKIIKSPTVSEKVIQSPPQKQLIQKIHIEVPAQKPLASQITSTNILNPPEVINQKPKDLSSQNKSTILSKPKKMDVSWTTLIIIALTLFTVVDLILLIVYFTSAKPLTSPIP